MTWQGPCRIDPPRPVWYWRPPPQITSRATLWVPHYERISPRQPREPARRAQSRRSPMTLVLKAALVVSSKVEALCGVIRRASGEPRKPT